MEMQKWTNLVHSAATGNTHGSCCPSTNSEVFLPLHSWDFLWFLNFINPMALKWRAVNWKWWFSLPWMCPRGEKQLKRKKRVPWVLQKSIPLAIGRDSSCHDMAIVTSSLMSDHQNCVRICSLLNIAKLACLADYEGGQFCTCLSCHRGRNLVPFFYKFASTCWEPKSAGTGL